MPTSSSARRSRTAPAGPTSAPRWVLNGALFADGFETGDGSRWFEQDTPGIPGDAESPDNFGAALACGDFNADGFADLAVGVPGEAFEELIGGFIAVAGTVDIVPGSALGLAPASAISLDQETPGMDGSEETCDQLGSALAAGDLAIGIPGEDGGDGPTGCGAGNGAIQIVFGGSSGLTATGNR